MVKFALICLALTLPFQAQATMSMGCHGTNMHLAHQAHQSHHAHEHSHQHSHQQSHQFSQRTNEQHELRQAVETQAGNQAGNQATTQDSACLHCAGCCPGFAPHGQMIQIGPFMASIAPVASTSRMALKEIPQGLLRPPR